METNPAYFINQPAGIIEESITKNIVLQCNPLKYHQSLPTYAPSRLVRLKTLAEKYGVAEVWVKDESKRFGLCSFKALGASYAIAELIKKDSSITTFCTATDGNHGRAVAWAAKLQDRKAVVFVPQNTAASRIQAIQQYGATVIDTNKNYDETCAIAAQTSTSNNWQLVQDTAWPGYEEIPALIMAGYLTHFKELENSLHLPGTPQVDIVFLQAGVGSWAASAALYYNNLYKKNIPLLVITEPENADGILESFKQNKISYPKGSLSTIMAGLNCGVPSYTAWPILKNFVHSSIRISEGAAEKAMQLLYKPFPGDLKIEAGESGAAGIAAMMEIINNPVFTALKSKIGINKNTRILCYVTEGITDPENFEKIINK